ncbi:MAG: hypothetical protein K0R14_173 [Burkholderiales bacterium]|jgi:hypothetical protein|nr:hypothetical protein [Burkholderiales bacterium]
MFEVKTNIEIKASPEAIWNCLADTENYAKWNNFITGIDGEFCEGKQIIIKLSFPDNSKFTFKPVCIKVAKNQEIRWAGKWLFNWLFRGEHYFILTKIDEETTNLLHGEVFTGLMSNYFGKKHGGITYEAFNIMNKNLDLRVTSI